MEVKEYIETTADWQNWKREHKGSVRASSSGLQLLSVTNQKRTQGDILYTLLAQ